MDDLNNLFGGNQSTIEKVLEDLIKKNDIGQKTDLNMKQIKLLCNIKWKAELKNPENKNKYPIQIFDEKIMPYYMELKCSYKRKARLEIIDAIKNINDKYLNKEVGVMSSIMGGK